MYSEGYLDRYRRGIRVNIGATWAEMADNFLRAWIHVPINCGVPQGSILGTLCFSSYSCLVMSSGGAVYIFVVVVLTHSYAAVFPEDTRPHKIFFTTEVLIMGPKANRENFVART